MEAEGEGVVLGIGCTRGTPMALLARGVAEVLAASGLDPCVVRGVASIDTKRDEPGLSALAEAKGWPLTFFSAEQLGAIGALQTPSARVAHHVGVAGVAEPAARLLGQGALLVSKTSYRTPDSEHSMTIAVARCEHRDG